MIWSCDKVSAASLLFRERQSQSRSTWSSWNDGHIHFSECCGFWHHWGVKNLWPIPTSYPTCFSLGPAHAPVQALFGRTEDGDVVVPSDLGIDVWRTQRALERSLESEYHGILCNHHHYIYIYIYIYMYGMLHMYLWCMYVIVLYIQTDIALHCIALLYIS